MLRNPVAVLVLFSLRRMSSVFVISVYHLHENQVFYSYCSVLLSGNPWMAGGNRAHGPSRFIRHLRMKRALGIPSSHRMWPAKQMRGRDRRRGTWWDHKLNGIAIEGQDFAQDTQEGGADRFELIPDSNEEEGVKGSSLLSDEDEYVPETQPQEIVTVSRIAGPCGNQGRGRLG